MSKELKIKNSSLAVTISSMGAEITSVKKGEKELIWQADPSEFPGPVTTAADNKAIL